MTRKGRGRKGSRGGASQRWWAAGRRHIPTRECAFSGLEGRAVPLLIAPVCLRTVEGRQLGPGKRKEEAWFVLRIFLSSVLSPHPFRPPTFGSLHFYVYTFPILFNGGSGGGNKHVKRWSTSQSHSKKCKSE